MKKHTNVSNKILMLLITFLLIATVTGCSNNGKTTSQNNKDGNNEDENLEIGTELPKNIEVQVPARAGGGTDVMARTLGQFISKNSNTQLTIVNNTAGGGIVPLETVRNAKPDGSIIMQYHTSMLITSAMGMYDYDAIDDFTVIAVAESVEDGANVLVVSEDSKFNTLEELINYSVENPNELLFGTQIGGMTHIIAGMIEQETGAKFKIVEAGSDTDKLTSLVGNNIDVTLVNTNQAKQYIDGGRAKALGVVTKTSEGGRSSILEDVPSFVEQGYNVTFSLLNFILGPLDMDENIVNIINEYYTESAMSDEVNDVLGPAGMEMRFLDREEGIEKLSQINDSIINTVEELGLANEKN